MSVEMTLPIPADVRLDLERVTDLIIPAEPHRGLPSAAQFDVWGYICTHAVDVAAEIQTEIESLRARVAQRGIERFASLDEDAALSLVNDMRRERPGFLDELARQTVSCYYQQDRVLEVIGMPVRAPFPEGYEVHEGDLSLLEPVRKRGRIYREV